MFTDTHAHLDSADFQGELDALLQRARDADVSTIVTVGTNVKGSATCVEIAEHYPDVYAVVGIHPHGADHGANEIAFSKIRLLVRHPRVVAVGECGLDYNKNYSSREKQKELFAMHIRLSREAKKPLVIHCRDAYQDCV